MRGIDIMTRPMMKEENTAMPELHSMPDGELSEFLLRACHDLRAAARAVRTHSELILRDRAGAEEDLGQRLGFVVEGARQIDRLLDGLTGYSLALQTDAASFQRTRTDVLLRGVLQRLRQEISERHAEVVYGELPEVTGNPDRLMQVFEHLVRNALAYGGQDSPRIDICAMAQEGEWRFAVRDDGAGVEAAALEKIFKPFERLRPKERPGAGMGLAICRAIVERHGGRIWAESQPEGGAAFLFTLPAE